MITTIAVDDEPLALEVIKAFCTKVSFIKLAGTFTEPAAAFRFLNENPVDLLLLDINMPSISGIEFSKKVPKSTMVIFTTAHSEYAIEGFNLSAVDYLLKPFDLNRFIKAMEKARDYRNYTQLKENEAKDHFFVRVDYSLVKITFSDIFYIEGLDNYLKIHFNDGKTLLLRMSMKGILEKLPPADFVRVHRSYIIPVSKVVSIRNKIIQLGKQEIPVGTNYVEEVQQMFKDK
jgi:DNA-binding LytR/AlgR family response regulator